MRTRIAQSSVLPPVADEPASPFGDDSQEMASKINAQELEISQLKGRVKLLEDRERGGIAQSGDDTPIKRRSLDEWEEAPVEKSTERGSDDTKKMKALGIDISMSTAYHPETDGQSERTIQTLESSF
nr:reverse transcriptase domain-containing protein [Tanacetum cinerariifolium]